MRLAMHVRVALLFVVAATTVVASQQDIPRFRGGVDVVQFTATVLDKDRHPVTGLTAADFEVLVDGTPPAIAHSLRDDGSGRHVHGMSILSRSLVPGLLLAAAIPASAQQTVPAAQAPPGTPDCIVWVPRKADDAAPTAKARAKA